MGRKCFDEFISEIERTGDGSGIFSTEDSLIPAPSRKDIPRNCQARKLLEYYRERQRLRKDLEYFS